MLAYLFKRTVADYDDYVYIKMESMIVKVTASASSSELSSVKYQTEDQTKEVWQATAFFDAIQKKDFLEVLTHFSRGISRSYNETYCVDRSSGSISDGITFGVMNNEVTLSNVDFLICLEKRCKLYLKDEPKDQSKVESLLKDVKLRFSTK